MYGGLYVSCYLDKKYNTLFNMQMQVTYPSHHQWLKNISAGPEIDFSGSVAQKIHASLPHLDKHGVTYSIKPLSEDFLKDFMPMYVGLSRRVSAVRWGLASRIVWAWVLTIPSAALIAAICYHFSSTFL